ncbi:low-temperature-induced 65 kDa protein [Cornus florida]|uniref:low-temperature-induced 65 kDa protein n=1 Tax=Cornus florida TaxID=4283 RepID=UPI002897AA9B|nr:low-temperature-induced 65 kDa protein [Cornus florida]
MESQTTHPHAHTYAEDPHTVEEGEDEHHHEKKSVLKKVKAKARKIKDTLTKHGHGHDHEPDHDYHYDDQSEEDEEMVEDPQVDGAPDNIEVYKSVHHVPGVDKHVSFPDESNGTRVGAGSITGDVVRGREENIEPLRVNVGRSDLEVDPDAPRGSREAFSDPSNYQAKVSDPTGTGGETVGITPLLHSFNKMDVYDESAPTPKLGTGLQVPYTMGSHDQFSPETIPTSTTTTPGINTESSPKRFDATEPESLPHDTLSSYTGKVSSATSAITDKAVSSKNVIASKLGYGNKEETETPEMHEKGDTGNAASVGEYRQKIASAVTGKLAPVYEKVAEVGSTVMSKVPVGTGTEDPGHGTGEQGADKGVSVTEYLAGKFRPSDEDRALSEVISDAFQKRKEEPEESGKAKPMGKVTESEEVARRLGTDNEGTRNYKGDGFSGNMSTTKGVVDRLKGAVGTWFGKPSESQSSQELHGTSYGIYFFSLFTL